MINLRLRNNKWSIKNLQTIFMNKRRFFSSPVHFCSGPIRSDFYEFIFSQSKIERIEQKFRCRSVPFMFNMRYFLIFSTSCFHNVSCFKLGSYGSSNFTVRWIWCRSDVQKILIGYWIFWKSDRIGSEQKWTGLLYIEKNFESFFYR